MNFFRKPPNNTDDFSSVSDFVRKEQQLTMQLESEQFWRSLENFVDDSLCNWHDEQCSQFTDRFYRWNFFFFVLFFFHCNSLGIYRGNIFVCKIPGKFTDENILSVFLFVFIDFLVVSRGPETLNFFTN